ncbi:hypothetical protein KIPB_000819, partial [Kipferlia bialata]
YLHDLEPNHLVTSSTHVRVVVFSPVQPTSVTYTVDQNESRRAPLAISGSRRSRDVANGSVEAGEECAFLYTAEWDPSLYSSGLHTLEVRVATDSTVVDALTDEERLARHMVDGISIQPVHSKVYPFSLDGTSMSLYDKGDISTFVSEITDSVGDLFWYEFDFPELAGRAYYFSIFHSPIVVATPFLCVLGIIVVGSVLVPKCVAHAFVTKQALPSFLVHNNGSAEGGADPEAVKLSARYTQSLMRAVSKGHTISEAQETAKRHISHPALVRGFMRYCYCQMHESLEADNARNNHRTPANPHRRLVTQQTQCVVVPDSSCGEETTEPLSAYRQEREREEAEESVPVGMDDMGAEPASPQSLLGIGLIPEVVEVEREAERGPGLCAPWV